MGSSPYIPVFLRTFKSHINVKITSAVKSIKYVYEYITKGNDKKSFTLKNNDELDEKRFMKVTYTSYIHNIQAIRVQFGEI